ncbi:ammonium transporter [Geminocystis sp. NIES-3709]|uniref:ammonium transporter n=1 Tax=Geminocystis sp. NIES-3709 TaxID=1617448 RepID=UPI0008254E6C|nr:ammonium transporter [Geminocystis sp. NIES-3709]
MNKRPLRSKDQGSFILNSILWVNNLFSPYWLACIPLTAVIVLVWNTAAMAQGFSQPEDVGQLKIVLDSVFLLITGTLVVFMNAGFAMLETGFCRQKNAVNVLAKNLIVFAIASVVYWAVGYGLMYGNGNGFIGLDGFFFNGSSLPYSDSEAFEITKTMVEGQEVEIKTLTKVPESISFFFQLAFSATAATIVSGAVAERIRFDAFLIFSVLLIGIAYPITGHWIWDGGWLASMGFRDFAGSTAVHSVGGWAALMGAAILGPRQGKYSPDGTVHAIPGHNMSIATLGCLILWIGWFGFNPGSELAATGNISYIALTTNLAGAAGCITATGTSWAKDGKPDLSMIINGVLAGLVGVTAGCADVSYIGAIIIGAVAGVLVVFAVEFFDKVLKIDDPVGATSVHLVCGVWGTLAVGIFSTNGHSFLTQLIGVLTVGGFTVVLSSIFWYGIKATSGLRVHPEEEVKGLDISEHGMEAYSGFVKEADILAGGFSSTVGEVSSGIEM